MNFPHYSQRRTSRSVRELLPRFLEKLSDTCDRRVDLLLLAWPEAIGEKLAPMTHAVGFSDGILEVKVFNSTLLSLLHAGEKKILFKKLREKFPKMAIREIRFRLA